MKIKVLFIALVCFASSALAADGVREALKGSISISSSDSITSLTRISSTRLGVDLIDRDAGSKHTETADLSSDAMQNVLEAAAIEGLPVAVADPEALMPPPPKPSQPVTHASTSSAENSPPHKTYRTYRPAQTTTVETDRSSESSEPSVASSPDFPDAHKNKFTYLEYQTALSTYVYGLSLPLAFGVTSPRVLIATTLISAPIAFGVHLYYANSMEFDEAHLKGTLYAPIVSVYAANALPLAFSGGDFKDGYRVASLLTAAAYPLSLWYGYHLGDEYKSNPDQLDLKFKFALGYAFLGFVTPTLYYGSAGDHSSQVLRLALGQSAVMAGVGSVVADYYRSGPNVPAGVQTGVYTQAALGGLAGLEVAALCDASSARPWIGAAVLGTSLGFTGGVFFFHNSNDNLDRALYSGVGAAGGAMIGTGLELLFYNNDNSNYSHKVQWSSFMIGGAWLGYWTVYELTSKMVDEAHAGGDGKASPSKWAFNPLPVLEPVVSRGEIANRWVIPGFSRHF